MNRRNQPIELPKTSLFLDLIHEVADFVKSIVPATQMETNLTFASAADVPPPRASWGSEASDAAAAARGELRHTISIWNSANSQDLEHTLDTQSKPAFESDVELSPPASPRSSVIDLDSPVGSDYDLDFVEDRQELPQADGVFDDHQAESVFPGLLYRRRRRRSVGEQRAASASSEYPSALPGTNDMDAGGSSNAYGDSDWQQAGQNATQQDLAGPGQHGYLECAVGNPKIENEGGQNAYVSYLVTTDVLPSSSSFHRMY